MALADEHPDLRRMMVTLYNSDVYQNLRSYYDRKSVLSVLGVARKEIRHSNFIAWLLNPGESHGLGVEPITFFFRLIAISKLEYPINREQGAARICQCVFNAFVSGNYCIQSVCIDKEVPVNSGGVKAGSVDLFLKVKLCIGDETKILPILIENKVESDEHGIKKLAVPQTIGYYNWCEKECAEHEKYWSPIYIYLTPDGDWTLRTGGVNCKKCECKQFIHLNYQGLVDFVIAPLLKQDISSDARFILNDYMRSLSYEEIETEKGKVGTVMAIAADEKKLLVEFWNQNRSLFMATINALREVDDDELNDDDKEAIQAAAKTLEACFDTTKYRMGQGVENYGKGRLVLAATKKFVNDHPDLSAEQVCGMLNKVKNKMIVELTDDIRQPKDGRIRYFIKDDDIVKIGGHDFVITNQWGIGNIGGFITWANEHGLDIKPV